jgi:hypothetical protein
VRRSAVRWYLLVWDAHQAGVRKEGMEDTDGVLGVGDC